MTKSHSFPLIRSIVSVSGICLFFSMPFANAQQCPAISLPDKHPAVVGKDMRSEHTQPWCDPVCVNVLANGTACNNASGQIVTTLGVCNDGDQVRESIKDIEYNLCIDIDQVFIDQSDYTGQPPGTNYTISTDDAALYFAALFSKDDNGNGVIDGAEATAARDKAYALVDELNTGGGNTITRNEASSAKGADPCQLLSTGFNSGLATDDILSYIGMYLGDPMLDKYAGDLATHISENMLSFTRTWQPSYWKQNGSVIGNNPSEVTTHYNNEYAPGSGFRVCDAGYNGKFKELVALMGGASNGSSGSNDSGGASGTGGTDTGGTDTGGTDAGGTDAGGTDAGGTDAGGTDAGGTDTGGSSGSTGSPSNNCPGSHPFYCEGLGQCFDQNQMTNYCPASNTGANDANNGSNTNGNNSGTDSNTNTGSDSGSAGTLTPSNQCPSSHPYMCESRGQCFDEFQMNTYCN